MGVSIFAYSNLKVVTDNPYDEDGDPIDQYVVFFNNRAFPDHYGDLKENTGYTGDYHDGPDYSYGGYNAWREQLAKMAGYPLTEYEHFSGFKRTAHAAACWQGATGPFSEQINFSDCEGSISTEYCKKLLADYITYEPQAQALGGEFYKGYVRFKQVFEHASNNGAVKFS